MGHVHQSKALWVRTDNYDSFHWKQTISGKKDLEIIFANKLKFGISFKTSLCRSIESNEITKSSTTNNGTSPRSKHHIQDELIMYAKAAWNWVIKQIKLSSFFAMALLEGFAKTWGARNVLCRRNNLHIEWNWNQQHRQGVQLFVNEGS